jgi:hypothetical protein
MAADRAATLIALQDRRGFFASEVDGQPDRNGFATVQVLRALGPRARRVLGTGAWSAALGALRACRNPATGAFRFWPIGERPRWAPDLPDDADDTALMAVALWSAGALPAADLRRLACYTVVRHRLAAIVQPGPAWPRVGAFKTWMRPGLEPDMADCTVNANVVAMLAAAGLTRVPGYGEACAMIDDAVRWAGHDAVRAATLSPFYPEPGELVLAVEAAVAAGAEPLRSIALLMEHSPLWREQRRRACAPDPVICGSPYGRVTWRSKAVGIARAAELDPIEALRCESSSHSIR